MKKSVNKKFGYGTKQTSQNNVREVGSARQFKPAPAPKPLTKTFASVTSNKADSSRQKANVNNDEVNVNNIGNANDLWSFAQVSEILLNSLNDLAKCKSKFDQIRVIANILQNAFE